VSASLPPSDCQDSSAPGGRLFPPPPLKPPPRDIDLAPTRDDKTGEKNVLDPEGDMTEINAVGRTFIAAPPLF
jgi:hypothetical protein